METDRPNEEPRWAPWWAYVVPILALNYLRQVLLSPDDVGDVENIGLFIAVTVLVGVLVTLGYRGFSPRTQR